MNIRTAHRRPAVAVLTTAVLVTGGALIGASPASARTNSVECKTGHGYVFSATTTWQYGGQSKREIASIDLGGGSYSSTQIGGYDGNNNLIYGVTTPSSKTQYAVGWELNPGSQAPHTLLRVADPYGLSCDINMYLS